MSVSEDVVLTSVERQTDEQIYIAYVYWTVHHLIVE